MIFNSNQTSLGAVIPMAEGYDCNYGTALALVESARNDYEMFKVMIGADYQELGMRQSGYTNESSIVALQEAVGGGIFKKIAELFKKLVAKVKSIFHTFVGKMNGLFMKDKDLVKKYEKEVLRKSNIGNLEVKWCKKQPGSDKYMELPNSATTIEGLTKKTWHEDVEDRYKEWIDDGLDWDSYASDFDEKRFDDEETLKISEIDGGMRGIMNYLTSCQKNMNDLQNKINKQTRNMEKLVSDANKKANATATLKNTGTAGTTTVNGQEVQTGETPDQQTEDANHAYDMAVAYQTVMLKKMQCIMDATKKEYKQNRAAFNKAITANDEKLKESTLSWAVAEAAEDEVEDVISGAISKEDLSDLTSASDYVKDGDVSDDPEKLVYDKVQKYTDDAPMDTSVGSIDVDVNARTESAFFGALLY